MNSAEATTKVNLDFSISLSIWVKENHTPITLYIRPYITLTLTFLPVPLNPENKLQPNYNTITWGPSIAIYSNWLEVHSLDIHAWKKADFIPITREIGNYRILGIIGNKEVPGSERKTITTSILLTLWAVVVPFLAVLGGSLAYHGVAGWVSADWRDLDLEVGSIGLPFQVLLCYLEPGLASLKQRRRVKTLTSWFVLIYALLVKMKPFQASSHHKLHPQPTPLTWLDDLPPTQGKQPTPT